MFGQFSTCDLVEFQRLLWSGGRRGELTGVPTSNNNNTGGIGIGGVNNPNIIVGQQQFIQQQQPAIITSGIHQPTGGVITTNTNSTILQNTMPVPRHHNFLNNNQTSVSFTTQPTTRYIPNQPQSRGMNQSSSSHHNNTVQQQQQPTQPHFSQIVPLDLGKQAQEARAREMVPEFEEQYFIQSSSPTKISPQSRSGHGHGHGQSSQGTHLHRPQPHIPSSQTITEHLSRAYPQQDLIQMHRQRLMQEQQEGQQQSRSQKKPGRHEEEMYETEIHEMEVDDHRDDEDYNQEEEEEDDEDDEDYEEYEPVVPEEGPWKCGVCRKIYKRKANFLAHQKTHKGETVVVSHQLQQQQGPAFKCTICEDCFLTDKTFQRHMKTHERPDKPRHSNSKSNNKQQQLQAAISSISSVQGVRPHQIQQQHYQQPVNLFQYKCDYCQEQFAVQQQLKAHEQLHLAESTLRCVTCDKPFLREDEFNQHIKMHLTETVWKCTICNTKFDEYKIYKDHLQSHLPVVYKEPPPKPVEPEKPIPPEESKIVDDDDIIEMEVISSGNGSKVGSAKKSPSKSNGDEKRTKLDDLAGAEWVPIIRSSTSRASPSTARRYATGSNLKVTGKAAQAGSSRFVNNLQAKRTPQPQPSSSKSSREYGTPTPSTSSASKIKQDNKIDDDDDDDDDIVILSSSVTPHRPIPIRSTSGKKYTSMKTPLPNSKFPTPSSSGMKHSAALLRRNPPVPVNKHRPAPPPPRHRQPPPQKHRPPPVRSIQHLQVDMAYKFQCVICKSYLSDNATLRNHVLAKHCSAKSIEIVLLKLEDDPELDLEIIDDEEEPEPEPSVPSKITNENLQ